VARQIGEQSVSDTGGERCRANRVRRAAHHEIHFDPHFGFFGRGVDFTDFGNDDLIYRLFALLDRHIPLVYSTRY